MFVYRRHRRSFCKGLPGVLSRDHDLHFLLSLYISSLRFIFIIMIVLLCELSQDGSVGSKSKDFLKEETCDGFSVIL